MTAARAVRMPPAVRIRRNVRVDDFGCWIWTGKNSPDGYGVAAGIGAHRLSYQAFVGRIPDGFHLDHLCRVHNCVNPGHLEPVTPVENIRRGLLGVLGRNTDYTDALAREAKWFEQRAARRAIR